MKTFWKEIPCGKLTFLFDKVHPRDDDITSREKHWLSSDPVEIVNSDKSKMKNLFEISWVRPG